MKLYIDIDSNKFITDAAFKAPVTGVDFMAGDAAEVQLVFVTGNTALSATEDRQIILGIKQAGVYTDGAMVVSASDYSVSGTSYILTPNLNTESLDALLGRNDDDSGTDVASLNCSLQVTWSLDAGVTWVSTNIITTTIYHDLISGVESSPIANQTMIEWMEQYHPAPLSLSAAPVDPVTITVTGTLTDGYLASVTFPTLVFALNTPTYTLYTDDGLTDFEFGSHYALYVYADTLNLVKSVDLATTAAWSAPYVEDFSDAVWTADFGDGTPLVVKAETAGKLGQDAIVNEADVYKCVREVASKWIQLN